MKKLSILLLLIVSLFTFAACSSNTSTVDNTSDQTSSVADDTTSNDKDDILVAYFSYTGNTEKVAEYIHDKYTNSSIFEIEPVEAYTEEDIDHNDENSRSKQESNDVNSRPEIKDKVTDMDKYSYVFLGYPIWYSEAPRIIDTFLESYDFSGKTIIPFCTSTSSGIGSSATNLEGLAPGADWLSGMRFSSDVDEQTVLDWLDTLDVK